MKQNFESLFRKTFRINWFYLSILPIFLSLIAYFVLQYQYAFNYQILFNENYNLAFFCSIFLFFSITKILLFHKIDLRSIFFVALSTILLYSSYHFVNNEYLTILACLSLCSVTYQSIKLSHLKIILYILFFLFVYNTIICAYSLLVHGKITGIFNNHGIVGIYSAINIPFLFFFISKKAKDSLLRREIKYRSLITLLALISLFVVDITIVIKSESRTALITSCIILTLYLVKYISLIITSKPLAAITKSAFIIIFLTTTMICIFGSTPIKERSLSGRLLMVKIAANHWDDNIWFGTGLGKFSWFYPQWQADFFNNANEDKVINSHIAGETYIIFNELLQIFLSVGIIGFVIFCLILFLVFKTKSKTSEDFLFSLKCIIIGILVSSLASYPFHVNIILLLFITVITVCFRINQSKSYIHSEIYKNKAVDNLKLIACLICLTVCAFLSTKSWYRMNAALKWHNISKSNSPYSTREKAYQLIYPELKDDGKFLTDYASFILEYNSKLNEQDIIFSIKILETAKDSFITKEVIETLAYAYIIGNDLNKALYYLNWIENFLPHLLEPKLTTMQIHIKNEQYQKSKEIGLEIIETIPKIPSLKTNQIKAEARYLMNKYRLYDIY